ncbi:MAG: hypothetical protein ACRDF4_01395 [Rhabdochlamydiaceae bacterium]
MLNRAIVVDKTYEPKITLLFKQFLRKSKMTVEVGANIGWYSLLSAANAEKVYAFEPDPVNC